MVRAVLLLALLPLVLAACSTSSNLPQPSLLYEEPYDVVFDAAVDAAATSRVEGVALPVTRVDRETGVVQLRGDPLGEGVDHAVAIVVLSSTGGRTVVVVRHGTTGPSGSDLAAKVAVGIRQGLDARLTRANT